MPRVFNNRCTDIFPAAELADMFEGFQYRAPKLATSYEAYLDHVDKSLAARITWNKSAEDSMFARDMKNPNFLLRKILCFDLEEYDRRVEEYRHESQLMKRASKVIKKYSQV